MEAEGPRHRAGEGNPGAQRRGGGALAGGDALVTSRVEEQPVDGGFRTLFKIAIAIVIIPIAYIITLDQMVDDDIDPESFSLPARPRLEGTLSPNELLTKAEKIYDGAVYGPESLAISDGHLYTGTVDGLIVDLHDNQVRVVARLGKPPCGGYKNEPSCGRPLGMRFNSEGDLIVVDAYLGMFKVNIKTGDSEMMLDAKNPIEGKTPKFLNDIDIASDGMIYFTDSSHKWERRNWPIASLENQPLGRLMQFNPRSSEVKVLMDGLNMANGVQISPDGSYLLVCETGRARVQRYYLRGPRQGESEIFVENLPGFPDNIRPSSSGGYWVGLASHRSAGAFSMVDALSTWPSVRRALGKALGSDVLLKFLPKYGLILELDSDGNIIRSLHDPRSSVISGVSEVEEADGVLYLGSFHDSFIGKLDLNKIK